MQKLQKHKHKTTQIYYSIESNFYKSFKKYLRMQMVLHRVDFKIIFIYDEINLYILTTAKINKSFTIFIATTNASTIRNRYRIENVLFFILFHYFPSF